MGPHLEALREDAFGLHKFSTQVVAVTLRKLDGEGMAAVPSQFLEVRVFRPHIMGALFLLEELPCDFSLFLITHFLLLFDKHLGIPVLLFLQTLVVHVHSEQLNRDVGAFNSYPVDLP